MRNGKLNSVIILLCSSRTKSVAEGVDPPSAATSARSYVIPKQRVVTPQNVITIAAECNTNTKCNY